MLSIYACRSLFRVSLALLAATVPAACTRAHAREAPTPVVRPLTSNPPSSFQETTSDARIGRVIDVREGLGKAAAFKAATEVLADVSSVDVSDQHAGFLMSPWQASVVRNGLPDVRYRTRVVIRFLGENWSQASVRAEANWQNGDSWDVGVDNKLLARVSDELRERIGKR
jgi:hypothetical protein